MKTPLIRIAISFALAAQNLILGALNIWTVLDPNSFSPNNVIVLRFASGFLIIIGVAWILSITRSTKPSPKLEKTETTDRYDERLVIEDPVSISIPVEDFPNLAKLKFRRQTPRIPALTAQDD